MTTMGNALTAADSTVLRPLQVRDFEDCVAIDARIVGRTRRAYFERRLHAAAGSPEDHVQFAAVADGALAGYVLARRMRGEFGRAEPGLRVEAVGVRPERQRCGIGVRLLGALARWGANHGVRQLRTTAPWRDHAMLAFLDRVGFELGDRVIDCAVEPDRLSPTAPQDDDADQGREANYGVPPRRDFAALGRDRVEPCSLAMEDLPGIQSIDRAITGRDRSEYLAGLVDEAIADSGVRVSLVARRGGRVAGFLMARTDFGDFGRTEPIAVIDTIGVDRALAGAGIGAALLSQLFLNLNALGVQRVETVVAAENRDLLAFFHKAGFRTGDRLAFVKHLNGEDLK